jgi:hypothetical protein
MPFEVPAFDTALGPATLASGPSRPCGGLGVGHGAAGAQVTPSAASCESRRRESGSEWRTWRRLSTAHRHCASESARETAEKERVSGLMREWGARVHDPLRSRFASPWRRQCSQCRVTVAPGGVLARQIEPYPDGHQGGDKRAHLGQGPLPSVRPSPCAIDRAAAPYRIFALPRLMIGVSGYVLPVSVLAAWRRASSMWCRA